MHRDKLYIKNNFSFHHQWKPFKSGQKCQYPVQTSADKDSESPDSSVLSLSGRTDRQRTEFFFLKIRTESGAQILGSRQTPDRFSGKSGQNEIRIGHGQCCPPTPGLEPRNIERPWTRLALDLVRPSQLVHGPLATVKLWNSEDPNLT